MVRDCGRQHVAKGLCSRHWNRQRKGLPLDGPVKPDRRSERKCSVTGCEDDHSAKGLCAFHRRRQRAGVPLEAPRRVRPKVCEFPGCGRKHAAYGLCQWQWRQKKKGQELRPLAVRKPRPRLCRIEGCPNPPRQLEMCPRHYQRWRKGIPMDRPFNRSHDAGYRAVNPLGYVYFHVPGKGNVYEHRAVMEHFLDRPLTSDEEVHHINGDRADNRIENLELWSKSQPAGQRVRDKVKWAGELLTRYALDDQTALDAILDTVPDEALAAALARRDIIPF